MPDKLMRAQVTIPLDSGFPQDSLVNTFYFDGDEDLDGIATDADYHNNVFASLTGFYQAFDDLVFPESVAPEATVRIYDMRDAKPRQPEFEDTFALTPALSPPMPNELAVCLSFQAVATSGALQRRRRGRVYIGPIRNHSNAVVVIDGQARPSLEIREAICNAADEMKQSDLPIGIGGSVRWSIYSRTTDLGVGSPALPGTSIDDAFHDVDNGWCDDAFDIQRRRGPDATARVVFP